MRSHSFTNPDGKPRRTRRALATVAMLGVAGSMLAGCSGATAGANASPPTATGAPTPTATDNGIPAMSVKEILTAARSTLAATQSFHVNNDDNQKGGIHTVADIYVSESDFKGTVTFGDAQIEIVKQGDVVYVRGDEYWNAKLGSDLVKGKYARLDESSGEFYHVLVDFFGRSNYVGLFNDIINTAGGYTKGKVSTVDGQLVIPLTNGDERILVAAMGEPYPIRVESGAGVVFDFSEFGEPVEVEAPPVGEVLVIRLK